jgi:hypothetical protein
MGFNMTLCSLYVRDHYDWPRAEFAEAGNFHLLDEIKLLF